MEWTLEKLELLIKNEVQESLRLEYKAAGAVDKKESKKRELSKDFTAFANSDGGTLILGISEFDKPDKSHRPERLDPIDRVAYPKEWIEEVLIENSWPRVNGAIVKVVEISPNKVVYVVEIPKSNTAHQAKDFRYYKRYNFSSKSMFDYEVRDVMNRQTTPKIDLKLKLVDAFGEYRAHIERTSNKEDIQASEPSLVSLRLSSKFDNVGSKVAKYVKCDIYIPVEIVNPLLLPLLALRKIGDAKFVLYEKDNLVQDVIDEEPGKYGSKKNKYGPKRYEPILPGRHLYVHDIHISNIVLEENEHIIHWTVFADDAQPYSGSTLLKDIPIVETRRN